MASVPAHPSLPISVFLRFLVEGFLSFRFWGPRYSDLHPSKRVAVQTGYSFAFGCSQGVTLLDPIPPNTFFYRPKDQT